MTDAENIIAFGDARLPSRFWDKVEPLVDGCWAWRAQRTQNGYGRFWIMQKLRLAHRVAYTCLVGTIPDELEMDHLCRVRACVNPAHLEAVSHRENTLRGEQGKYLSDKTHCKHGHAFTADNTLVKSNGYRDCRACHRRRVSEHYYREKSNVQR